MSQPVTYYRSDGVRITHDPHAKGMAEKYGMPGQTDSDGFDPYADTVGAGIYGGNVLRDAKGAIVWGEQYQGHNPRPGPVYDGTGYTRMSKAIQQGRAAVEKLLDEIPDAVNEVSTGGATPLHMCGMSQKGQTVTSLIIARGGNIEAKDTYGFTPLHRMASNNLPIGASALLEAGADPNASMGGITPLMIAKESHAWDVVRVLQEIKGA